ncbi:type II secretion system protein [Methylomonas sp. ZR1]|uniref:type II secretion system protein n=1 Tax=Methylomonas sp. ZR1 TaxID=1797072 RepID=UPI001490C5B8|nr:prepilin-type N-terminal cleavage/methylation domain-containing protein [Methylomonas sp. ZR1]NOV28942.1 prepilin-type N-terminal cleavage/methylation domain-containing protein [Methylomonas sp. ZR1]
MNLLIEIAKNAKAQAITLRRGNRCPLSGTARRVDKRSASTACKPIPVDALRLSTLPAVGSRHHKSERGFTLLEMLLVIFLMALVASTGLMLTEGVEDQTKYDETKRRMEMIRKAIVGDPSRTVNGAPELSGFVADMGRLPLCLAELLRLGDEVLPATVPKTFKSPCDVTEIVSEWYLDQNTGVGIGWRGPYLQVIPESGGGLRFRDGYGNEGANAAADALDSGWDYSVTAATASLASEGMDLTVATDDVAAPQLIVSADWQVQIPAAVSVTFENQSGAPLPGSGVNLVLRLYLSDLTDYVDSDEGTPDYLVLTSLSVSASGQKTENFKLSTPPILPIGKRAYALICHEVPPGDPDNYRIFDGDCVAGNPVPAVSNIRSFSVLPRQTLNLALNWIIP